MGKSCSERLKDQQRAEELITEIGEAIVNDENFLNDD
jgi:hypothetical protein